MAKKIFRDEESSEIKNIYINPMESFTPEVLKSPEEAEKAKEEILDVLSGNDWENKCTALQRGVHLLKGGALQYPEFDIVPLVNATAKTIGEAKSKLVKFATLFLVSAAKLLEKNFGPCVDITISCLIKQSNHASSFIGDSCKYAILAITEYVQVRRTAKALLAETVSKIKERRLIVAQAVTLLMRKWPLPLTNQFVSEIKSNITKLTKDPSAEVRESAREALAEINGTPLNNLQSPSVVEQPRARSPTRMKQSPEKSFASFRKPRAAPPQRINRRSITVTQIPATTIIDGTNLCEFMPPDNITDANQFVKILSNMIASNHMATLEGIEFALPSSIVTACGLGVSAQWDAIIPALLNSYKNEFKSSIGEVLIATKSPQRTLKSFVDLYGVDSVVNDVIFAGDGNDVINVLAQMISLGMMKKIPENAIRPVRQLLSRVNSPEAEIVENAISSTDFSFFGFPTIREFITSDSFLEFDVSAIEEPPKVVAGAVVAAESDIAMLLSNEKYIDNTTIFLLDVAKVAGQMKMPAIVCELAKHSNGENIRSARCFSALCLLVNDVSDLIPVTEAEDGIVVVVNVIDNNSLPVDKSCAKLLENAIKFLNSPKVEVRRSCVRLCAKFLESNDSALQRKIVELPYLTQKLIADKNHFM